MTLKELTALVEDQQRRIEALTAEVAAIRAELGQPASRLQDNGGKGLFPKVEEASSASSDGGKPGAAPIRNATIFCDGACTGNPGPGGWGCIVEYDGARQEFSGGRKRTTNNQMELQALIEGLREVPSGVRVRIVTDSEYLSKGVSNWMHAWVRNGWMTSTRQPVKNQDQWMELYDLLTKRPYTAEWVRGHNGHPENERCDELARAAVGREAR